MSEFRWFVLGAAVAALLSPPTWSQGVACAVVVVLMWLLVECGARLGRLDARTAAAPPDQRGETDGDEA